MRVNTGVIVRKFAMENAGPRSFRCLRCTSPIVDTSPGPNNTTFPLERTDSTCQRCRIAHRVRLNLRDELVALLETGGVLYEHCVEGDRVGDAENFLLKIRSA